jgi:transposase-like protein
MLKDEANEISLKENKESIFPNVSAMSGEPAQFILTPAIPRTQVTNYSVAQCSAIKTPQHGTSAINQHHRGMEEASLTNGGSSKRKRFTAGEKIRILAHLEETSNLRATARKFGVDRKTIRSWMEHRDELRRMEEQNKERITGEQHPGVEDGMTPPSKRRRNLTPGEKLEIVEKTELGTTVRQVAKDYGVDPKSVRYWQRQKTDLQDQMKGGSPKMVHVSAIPFQYQQNLGVWLQVEESRGSNITYAMIVDKLRDITKGTVYESFNPTDSWLMKFKKKYSLKSGEGGQTIVEQGRTSEHDEPAHPPTISGAFTVKHERIHKSSNSNQVDTTQLKTVFVFNTLRELMNSTTDLGGVAMCEGNPKLFVNTTEGWLRAELAPSCQLVQGQTANIDVSTINVQLYKQEDGEITQEDPQ